LILFGVLVSSCSPSQRSIRERGSFRKKAIRDETLPLELYPEEALKVDLPAGRIRLRASADESPSLSCKLQVFAETQEEADGILEMISLRPEPVEGGVALRVEGGRDRESQGMYLLVADCEVVVPPRVKLTLLTGFGEITARGPLGSSEAKTGFGEIDLAGIRGDVRAISSSGGIRLADVEGHRIEASTEFGAIRITGVQVSSARVKTASGAVELIDLVGEDVVVDSSFGNIDLHGVQARSLQAHASSGSISAASSWTGSWSVYSGHGRVRVQGGSGSLQVESQSGKVEVVAFKGDLRALTGFGQVSLSGIFSSLSAASTSGRILAEALPGSRASRAWSLKSGFGDVELKVPGDLSCRLEAKTGFGTIESDFPLRIDPGLASRTSLRGEVNGGGETVTLETASGKILLRRL